MGFGGCPTLPSRFFEEDQPAPEGEVTWDSAPGSNRANVQFSFANPATGEVDLSGTLQSVPVVDVNAGPLLEGSRMNAADSTVAPTRGSVLHEPGRENLIIELWYETATESSSEIVELDRFTGTTGPIDEEGLIARFSDIGKLVARVRSDRVATIPSLPGITH